jgi:alcohol dehydrogenase class IV
MSIACLEAGIAFSNAILGAVHALAHPLGGFYDIHHGLANAVLLPIVVRRNMEHSLDKYARIAKAMGADTNGMSRNEAADCALYKIQEMIDNLELPTRLSGFDVNPEDFARLAELAKEDICMLTNPYCYSIDEIEALYREAW